ncbi:cortactin-binding protein 2 [Hypomesus transpacificus]|uniref:cortactin-binding protein 2 n=1 Tax=Hypomesus transpacificus TaxID=137520 RepID=UPI001F07751F|nr:cortactin-binding protein 2 [Hypomesus transpacificus]
MASEGTSGEQPPPIQTLATTVLGNVEGRCEFNMDNLSKPELLTLLSIMEGELEARDLVIEALRARRKELFVQERYSHFSVTDPFLALQRDFECVPGGDKERRPVGSSPMSVLEAVMAHCRKMQERMSAQLAAAESRQKRLELEKLQLQSLEQEHRKLTAQLKDEREKNKHIVMMLVRECKQLATRVVEESQRFDEISARLDEESRQAGQLQEELSAERQRGQQMEAKMEKQLSEFDTEREQLRARLGREEAESQSLRQQVEQLRTKQVDVKDGTNVPVAPGVAPAQPPAATPTATVESTAATSPPAKPKSMVSIAVATEPISSQTASCQVDLPTPTEAEGPKKTPLTIPIKPTPANYAGLSLPKSAGAGRGLVHSSSAVLPQAENGGEGGQTLPHGLPTGMSPRVQAARYKFQEQDQNGSVSQSPPVRDLSPTNRDNFAAKQQARHTVTQVLSRFTSPPVGGAAALRPGLPHSTSEGGSFPGRLGHSQIGHKSPTVARIDRGNPPPIPPKKPGLSQTPSPPHPPIKLIGDGSRSPGTGLKPATPQLPPKPALDLVPALTASQVGASPPVAGGPRGPPLPAACAECPPIASAATTVRIPTVNPSSSSSASAPSRSPCAPGSPLATASGWRPSLVPSLTCGGPVALDNERPLLLQAASQGNVTLMSMLLNPDTMDITTTHLEDHPTSALFAAAQNGHTDCVKLLLTSGVTADVADENGFTPLHYAAAHGHHRCVDVLVGVGSDVNQGAVGGQSPLYMASAAGRLECVQALLNAGADSSRATTDSCTALHAAVSSGHVDTLRLLLCRPDLHHTDHPNSNSTLHNHAPVLSSAVLNQANCEGWTAAHIAAARGFKDCLEVLCSHSEQDIERRDNWNRTIHDVATDDCKDLLENLHSYRVSVCVQMPESIRKPLCPKVPAEEVCLSALGCVHVGHGTSWAELSHALGLALNSHLQLLCGEQTANAHVRDGVHTHLGLTPASIASGLIGDTVWLPGQKPSRPPWDLVRKPLCQRIILRLKGLSESCVDELALESLIPLQLLQNYIRLVEQYRNVIFHGLEGSCQEYLANQISRCIKQKQEVAGVCCDIIRVEVDRSLCKEQLVETFINCGFLVPVSGVSSSSSRCVVVLLEGLEKACSLTELLGDLCEALENRGTAYLLPLPHAQAGLHHFLEGGFLIGTLSKSRLQGSELRLQQHFRWVTLRWDAEPLHGLLGRHLRRKLLHKMQGCAGDPEGLLEKTLGWVSNVWQQLNACLSRLGTHEALLGPQLFLSCPVVPDNSLAIVKWLAGLWNLVVVPRVEEAIVSRVTVKRSPAQRPAPGDQGLSRGEQAVVKAALSILVNKAVLHGCPLPCHEIARHLLEFRGGTFPVSTIGSCKGSGGRKGRDCNMWRRASTSPRKKGRTLTNWSGSLREGSLSNTDVRFITNDNSQRLVDGDLVNLSLCSDDDTELIRELQTMCTSKSEPDISKIAQSKDEFVVFSGSRSGQSLHKTDHKTTAQQRPQTTSSHHANQSPANVAQSHERRPASRPKSQLPVPSSRGQPPRPSSSSSSTPNQANGNRNAAETRTEPSSKTRHVLPSNNNFNKNNQRQEDIWILHGDVHENGNNDKF